MDPDEIMSMFEGVCPDCKGRIAKWEITGHPDHLAESWSANETTKLVPNESMPRDFTWQMADGWIENILDIVEATCENGHEWYTERSAIDGDWH